MAVNKPKIIVIVGPTGSGKTALAVALARGRIGHSERSEESRQVTIMPRDPSADSRPQDDVFFELVSADSRQVYRGMDIGTGKEIVPDIPHHLINIVNPDEDFTLADFLDRAKKVIADIHARGKIPIVVGGTGLYVQALVENWQVPNIAPDKKVRAELEKKSVDELRRELAAIDPKEAERLERGKRYLVRALEMWHATGRKPSALKTKNEPLYDAFVIGIDLPREELYARIDARVDDMFARGLVDEVRGLVEKYNVIARSAPGATKQSHEEAGILLPAFRTIGYREVIEGVAARGAHPSETPVTRPSVSRAGRISPSLFSASQKNHARSGSDTLLGVGTPAPLAGVSSDVIPSIKHHTHAYARRQLTWLRRMKYVKWVTDAHAAMQLVQQWLQRAR